MSEITPSEGYGASAHLRMRLLKDRLARYAVAIGGNSVIVAILLIFFYLLSVVLPLGDAPEMHPQASYQLVVDAPVEYLAMEEQAEIGVVIDRLGRVRFLSTGDGGLISETQLPIPERVTVDSFSAARPNTGIVALGLSNGQALLTLNSAGMSLLRELVTYTMEDSDLIPCVLKTIFAARAIGRIGDRSSNICEYVIYLVKGKDVRHTKLDKSVTKS
jgi:ABC-type uncharacterized transport system permease subunit